MIADRYTTRRIRARYIKALNAIPLPVRRTDPPDQALPIDLAGLPVLAVESIDDRRVRFSLVIGQTRFRLTFTDTHPTLIGSVANLDTPRPRLIIAEVLNTEWALANKVTLTENAARIWAANTRACTRQ